MRRSSIMRNAVLGGGFVLALAGFSGPAVAYDDGYQNVFSSVLTAVGVMPADKSPEIEYRERAPLVLPPSNNLNKPQSSAQRPASWPKDPDVAKRLADKAARAPVYEFDKQHNQDRPLSKQEMMEGRSAAYEPNEPGGCRTWSKTKECNLLTPDQLREQGEAYKAANPEKKDQVVAGQEPERLYLTQPPKGYMKATKTVKATAEAPEQRVDESNPKSQLEYHKKNDDE